VEDDCEVADIIRTRGCGYVVAPGDAAALAARVLDLAKDRGKAADFGTRARQAALEFDRPRQVAAYDALLREITTGC
jgi:glycosyltransferase involved in cell wall biosynthesis